MKDKEIEGIPVEWDDEKNDINYKKHGVLFEDAVLVFNDENRIEIFDDAHSICEERYAVIGMVKEVLFVSYTIRGSAYRIISARIANKREKKLYYGYHKNYC